MTKQPINLSRIFLSLDSFGTRPDIKSMESEEDARANQILNSTIRFENGRFEAGILWRNDEIEMPDSRYMAEKRMLFGTQDEENTDLEVDIRRQISEYQDKGHIRKMTKEELAVVNPRAWYLPMFVV